MNRGTFFKKLFQGAAVIAASPSILAEISAKSSAVAVTSGAIGVHISQDLFDNLPYLKAVLPDLLMRDYMKRENAAFMNVLKTKLL